MVTLDCLGDICPVPILKIKAQLTKTQIGETIKVVTDHSCVAESIVQHFKNINLSVHTDEVINGVWEIFITKN
jgi:tRNA 2-thiouridine synthesizing protein A